MISNCTVEIIAGTPGANGFGDTVITEAAPVVVSGHIGGLGGIYGETQNIGKDGLASSRCRIRIAGSIDVSQDSVFRVKGIRWKPIARRVSRAPQNHATYTCERME